MTLLWLLFPLISLRRTKLIRCVASLHWLVYAGNESVCSCALGTSGSSSERSFPQVQCLVVRKLQVCSVPVLPPFRISVQFVPFLFRSCLRPLKPHPQNNSSTNISDLIDLQQFLAQRPVSERPFYSFFFDTQIFTSFVEQRSFSHSGSSSLTFFDECTEKVLIEKSLLGVSLFIW